VQVQQLVAAAQQAMHGRNFEEATRLWSQVLMLSPEHPQALFQLGQQKMMEGNAQGAVALFERAARSDPQAAAIPLNIAFAHRAQGSAAAELQALERALAIDPYYYPALLAKAQAFERIGKPRQAARLYKDALAITPPDDQIPPSLRATMEQARKRVAENAEGLARHFELAIAAQLRNRGSGPLDRFERCKDALLGRKKIYAQQPTMLHYPELPAIQFYDNADFPWMIEIEAATGMIKTELAALLESERQTADTAEFRPYVQHPAGAPLNQWEQLNFSPRWSAYFLWEDGERNEAHCAHCPRTAETVEAMPLARIPGYAPAVFFSVLQPRTRIPPHTGVTNIRLIAHLPLVVPEACGFRVGNDSRSVEAGKAWVFDDTIEHEAWNDSDSNRYILIFDIWNPELSEEERELAIALLDAMRSYYSE